MAGVSITTTVDNDIDVEKWIDDAMQEVLARAKMRTPVKTGRLQGSLELEKKDAEYGIGSTVPYASFIEFGTVYIRPRRMIQTSLDELPQILEQKRSSLKK